VVLLVCAVYSSRSPATCWVRERENPSPPYRSSPLPKVSG
jgi:hypothetical protein